MDNFYIFPVQAQMNNARQQQQKIKISDCKEKESSDFEKLLFEALRKGSI